MDVSPASAESESLPAEQAKLLMDVSRLLAVTADLDLLLNRIAEAVTQLLSCERASIFLHDGQTNQLWTKVALQSTEIRVPSDRGIVGWCFTHNEIQLVTEPYKDSRFNPEPDRRSGFVTRNLLSAPMVSFDRKPIGVIQAVNKAAGCFQQRDLSLIQLLCDQAGLAIQRYQLQLAAMGAAAMRHEMKLAREVQDAALPKRVPEMPGIEVRGFTRPASTTGGDTFDYWRTSDGRLGLLLADASGHGLAPTMIVSQVRALVRAFSDDEKDPRKILAIANKRLYEDLGDGRFVTTFLAFLESNGWLTWCSAGHGPVYFRAAAGEPFIELETTDCPLAVIAEMDGRSPWPIQLLPGGLLVVTSDGLCEAMNAAGELMGAERLRAELERTADDGAECLIAACRQIVAAWQGSDEPKDDQTMLVVRRIE